MCDDPTVLSEEDRRRIKEFANDRSREFGFDDWIEAYHFNSDENTNRRDTVDCEKYRSSLFEDRIPEVAAIQLAMVLAWLTECNLATLEEMRSRKRTPKYAISRQESICKKAVDQCRDMKVPTRGLRGQKTIRLARLLQEGLKHD